MRSIIRRPKEAPEATVLEDILPDDDNNARIPVILAVDCSSSMQGAPIDELNTALRELQAKLSADIELSGKAVVCLISFGKGGVTAWRGDRPVRPGESPFVPASQFQPPRLQAGGVTPMVEAVELGIQLLADEVRRLRARHLGLYQPLFWCIGDGRPTDATGHYTDEWRRLPAVIAAQERESKFAFFSVSVGDIGPEGEEVFTALAPESHVRLSGFEFGVALRLVSRSVKESAQNNTVASLKRSMMEFVQAPVEPV